MKRAQPSAREPLREMTRRAQYEIVLDGARRRRARTLDGKRERFAAGEAKRIAAARQSDKTFERVPTVGAAAGHMQSQIDFRGRAFGEGLGQDGSRGQSSSEAIIGRLAGPCASQYPARRFAAHCLCTPREHQPPFFFGSV